MSRTEFLGALHRQAEEVSVRDEGDEGDRGFSLVYQGHLLDNYPWVYVDFKLSGAVPLTSLRRAEERLETFCAGQATYLSTVVNGNVMRCRLVAV